MERISPLYSIRGQPPLQKSSIKILSLYWRPRRGKFNFYLSSMRRNDLGICMCTSFVLFYLQFYFVMILFICFNLIVLFNIFYLTILGSTNDFGSLDKRGTRVLMQYTCSSTEKNRYSFSL